MLLGSSEPSEPQRFLPRSEWLAPQPQATMEASRREDLPWERADLAERGRNWFEVDGLVTRTLGSCERRKLGHPLGAMSEPLFQSTASKATGRLSRHDLLIEAMGCRLSLSQFCSS